MSERPPQPARGAVSNPTGRFERFTREAFDDGWTPSDEAPPPLVTSVRPERTSTYITRNDSPDIPFDRSLNPYKGCEHGCIYCFARPTHAFLGLSPGLDFESKLVSKPQGPDSLRRELKKPGYTCAPIALGANTDPYQPIERSERVTRRTLEVLYEHQHPVVIVTKSMLVLRDLDLLAPMAEQRLAMVLLSITTLDPVLARSLEPRAAAPARRLEALRVLHEAGVPVGVLASPMIPALNDAELERILEEATARGARRAGTVLIRLPHELKALFTEWLEKHYPERAAKVLALIRDTREGELYRAGFGTRMRGTGPYAELLRQRFDVACRRLGLNVDREPLDTSHFAVPGAARQLTLF